MMELREPTPVVAERDGGRRLSSVGRSALPLALVLVGAAALRLTSLDYSHFQGDEVKALFPSQAAFPGYLLEQSKGPIQFLVTLAVRRLTGGFVEGETRLPFSLASLLAVWVVYLVVREGFNRRAGLWAAALTGSCGLLVAFGRIVQYQSFVMLTLLLTAFLLIRWVRQSRIGFLYAGMICYSLALLSHYDALTFLPALLLLLGLGFRAPEQRTRKHLMHLVLASLLAVVLVAAFYIPFLLHPGAESVVRYLGGRVFAGLGWATFRDTGRLLGLYFPPLYLPVMVLLGVVGAVAALRPGARPFGPVILAWFAAPFLFYLFLGGEPRSHVYMVLLPGLMLAGLGIDAILARVSTKWAAGLGQAAAWIGILLVALMAWFMLVDHSREHPWEEKTVFRIRLPNLVGQEVQGVFGFPYRRGLDQVGEMYRAGRLQGTFDSNERDATVEYYFGARRSSPPGIYFDEPGSRPPDIYVYVLRPFSLQVGLPAAVARSYHLIDTITEGGRTTIEIYAAPGEEP